MKFFELDLKGAYVIAPEPFKDDRGSFARIFCEKEFLEIGHKEKIVQINHSINKKKGTLRGLHYQIAPAAEIKIVKCIKGAVFDVIVDIRRSSETFLSWHGIELTESNMKSMYVPRGFAHGFQTLRHDSELLYFSTEFYNPGKERALNCIDPELKIKWPLPVSRISERDRSHAFINKDFSGL
jgi:dTDP-4-dehydrorhamnose 3,5-epimerase